MCLRLSTQVHQQTTGSLLPLVEDWGVLRHVRNSQLVNWRDVFVVIIYFEIFGNIRVLLSELLKLLISDRFILPRLIQLCEQVSLLNFTFILALLGDFLNGLGLCLLLLFFFFLLFRRRCSTLDKYFDNLRTLACGGVLDESDTLVVFDVEIDSLFDKVLYHLEFVVLDCVKHW